MLEGQIPSLLATLSERLAGQEDLELEFKSASSASRSAGQPLSPRRLQRNTASIIVRSSDNYLFRNPGDSRVMDADLLRGGRSDPRNPALVRMFRLVGLAEEAGTGIPQIVRAWRKLGFRLPAIDVGTERYEFTIDLRFAHLLSEEDLIWLHPMGDQWEEEEQLALVLAKHEEYVDNQTLRKLTGKHSSDITKVLGSLRARELLTMSGMGRTARYQLGPKAIAAISGSLGRNDASLGRNDASLGRNDASLIVEEPNRIEPTADQDSVWARLEVIATPVREQRRISPVVRDSVILELCSIRPLSIDELARLLNRNPDFVSRTVRQLYRSGGLTFLYPDQPRHPHQKYVSRPPAAH